MDIYGGFKKLILNLLISSPSWSFIDRLNINVEFKKDYEIPEKELI